jgi:ADP-ribosylglycohydrolase
MGFSLRSIIQQELTQRREEGCDTTSLEGRIQAALEDAEGTGDSEFEALYESLIGPEPAADFPFDEPSTLSAIRARRPDGPRRFDVGLSDDELLDRIHGGWLGRAAGCALGKPVEGWPKKNIDSYLEFTKALPLDDYLPYSTDHPDGLVPRCPESTRGRIKLMERDDDMDYPILGLLLLEQKGLDFTSRGMANLWLGYLPYQLVYTAESVAYRNFVNDRWPPESATYRNPFREWIGAQIRADIFGWVTPGWPEKAAELAFRDARISHVKNGIYGEMFVAAMLSAAFVTDDIERIIEVGLSEIPVNCRLAQTVRDTVAWCRDESDWEVVWSKINERYGHYNGVHTINNAALVVMGLLFGANDYETGIVVAVRGGWDTDCNGATVGSILGVRSGARALPVKWVGVLNDRLLSVVRGCTENLISDLAGRTYRVAKRILDENRSETGTQGTDEGEEISLVGSWTLTSSWAGVETQHTLVVNPDLSGTLANAGWGTHNQLPKIEIDGNTVTFVHVMDKGGWVVEIWFEGFVHGDTITGDFFTGVGNIGVTGVRD